MGWNLIQQRQNEIIDDFTSIACSHSRTDQVKSVCERLVQILSFWFEGTLGGCVLWNDSWPDRQPLAAVMV